MIKWLPAVILLVLIPLTGLSQSLDKILLLDSRTGYTTNSYLNPMLSEWNRDMNTGYSTLTPMGNIFLSSGNFSSDLTAGASYSKFLDDNDDWFSFFMLLTSNYRLTDRFSAGIETGGSYYSTLIDRSIFWIQPVLSYSPSLFTRINLKAGSSFRKESGNADMETSDYEQFNNYSMEVETWPTLKWQLRAGIFGDLDNPTESLGARISSDFNISRNWNLNLRTGLERYRFQIMPDGGGGGGFPPVGGPGNEDSIEDEADILFRGSAGVKYQVNRTLELSVNTDYLNYFSTITEESVSDIHASIGFRVTLFNSNRHTSGANVELSQNGSQNILLNLKYSGNGQLYIVGDFNDWEKPGIPLSKQRKSRFVAQLSLDAGAYEYKVLLIEDGEENWLELSEDTFTVSDGFGGENGLIFID
jgi:hypothetical protein